MRRTTNNHLRMIATRENTVFITVAAYDDYESKTLALRQSAAKNGISLHFCDLREAWKGFYYHKIENMYRHLKKLSEDRKQFAFILDCRDVLFIDPLDMVLKKFNAIDDGRVIFNLDMPTNVWPSHKDYLASAMEASMNSKYTRLNAGMIAGNIEVILKLQHYVMTLRREFQEGSPRSGIAERLYRDIGTNHLDDDQHLYQICLTYYPELFRIDSDKKLFALLSSYPKERRTYSSDPRHHDVTNDAAIIHSPYLSYDNEWNDRVLQNWWQK